MIEKTAILLTMVFIALKLTGAGGISWWLVFLPVIIITAYYVVALFIATVAYLLSFIIPLPDLNQKDGKY